MERWGESLVVLAAVALLGCEPPPAPNVPSEMFAREYNAVEEACEALNECSLPPLSRITFTLYSYDDLQREWCGEESCVGAAGVEDDFIVLVDSVVYGDRCRPLTEKKQSAGKVVVHELVHTAGIGHEEEERFQLVLSYAWMLYLEDNCVGDEDGMTWRQR